MLVNVDGNVVDNRLSVCDKNVTYRDNFKALVERPERKTYWDKCLILPVTQRRNEQLTD